MEKLLPNPIQKNQPKQNIFMLISALALGGVVYKNPSQNDLQIKNLKNTNKKSYHNQKTPIQKSINDHKYRKVVYFKRLNIWKTERDKA